MGGEHYRDQFHYSRGLVAELLPWALDGLEPPAKGFSDMPRGVSDPAEGGNVLAMMIDVRRAVSLLPDPEWRLVLSAHFNGRDVPDHVLDAVVDALGGPRA